MTGRRRDRVLAAVAASGAAILSAGVWLPAPAAALGSRQVKRAAAVEMQVLRVTPSTPVSSSAVRRLRIVLSLTNTTSEPIRTVQILATRGSPLAYQSQLNKSLGDAANSSGELPIPATRPVTTSLGADSATTVVFDTTTGTQDYHVGLCLCADAVYPINLSAVAVQNGDTTTVGSTRTWVPAFKQTVPAEQVSWVWPLIDRPHRLTGTSVFTDDDLATSVSDGRLYRSLQVVAEVAPVVPLTVVLDPELIDELAVMATGRYTIAHASGKAAPGAGAGAAKTWLTRLRTVLVANPDVTVELTPYADPDVNSLAAAGVTVNPTLPVDMSRRVTRALDGVDLHRDMGWPAGGSLGRTGLDAAADNGARTLLLDRGATAPREVDHLPATVARLRTAGREVTAALTSPAIQDYVASTVSVGGHGAETLPQVVSELAIRTDQLVSQADSTSSGTVPALPANVITLAPPRYVDPSVQSAVRAIKETSASTFTRPASLAAMTTGSAVPATLSHLRPVDSSSTGLSRLAVHRARAIARQIPSVGSLLARSRPARRLVASLPPGLQRTESSAWRKDSASIGGPVGGLIMSRRLATEVHGVLSGVRIVKPSSGSYTLASNDSKLPVTVQNTLDYAVQVQVTISAVGDLPGFSARPVTTVLQPQSRRIVRIPAQVQRSGRIPIRAQLRTPDSRTAPDGVSLGGRVLLNVHSTVFGAIGVVITVVAGVVLVLALLLRYIRRIQRLRSRRLVTTAPRRRTAPASAERERAS